MSYRALSSAEAKKFLKEQGKTRSGVHNMSKKLLHWMYCATCGLLNLKNDVTYRALKSPCRWEE